MVKVFCHSEPGGHIRNEDAFEIHPLTGEFAGYLCVLADGQGGQSGGAEAAGLVCRVGMDEAKRLEPSTLFSPATWNSVLQTADRAVAEDPIAGYTTCVAFLVTGGRLCGASCGDSAAALVHGSGSRRILTARQQKDPPVGSGFATFVGFAVNLLQPWIVLAMSDGVWKYVGWEKIEKAVAEYRGKELIYVILEHARLRSGGLQDDFTIVAFSPE